MTFPSQQSVLVVGCGSIGERHLRCFLETRRATVTACDSNPSLVQRMAGTYGVPTVNDWESALASGKFTAAVICTPAPWHVPMATRALQGGIHVLVEKPLSVAMAGVKGLLDARDRSGAQAAVAYVFRVFPMLAQAKAYLGTGAIGPVRQALMVSGQPFHRLRPGYAQSYYRDRASGGGAIQDALTHSVNWMESVIGPADSVLADCSHQALAGVTVEDTVHVSTRHGDVLASYVLNQFQAPNETSLQLNGPDGSVRIEFHRQRWGHFLPMPPIGRGTRPR